MSKKATIGILIHHLDNDYSKTLLKGAVAAAKDMDVNLAIFPGRSLNSQLDDRKFTMFEYQHNVIYSYVTDKSLDAVIVSAGTVGSFVSREDFAEFIKGFGNVPVVTTENKVGDYPCIRLSGSGIKELVNHLVKEHGRKNIAFVSGPKNNADAQERLNYYKEALEENGMEYRENMVAYGKFSEYCVDIVGDLIDSNEGNIDAICFANDMMCKGGYKAIERRGLRVGADIAVTGYDDSEVAVSLKPMLTTVRADAAKLGYRAVAEAARLAAGSTVSDISLESSPIYRFSCGCAQQPDTSLEAVRGFIEGTSAEKSANTILREFVPRYDETFANNECIRSLRDYMARILRFAGNDEDGDQDIFAKSYFSRIIDSGLFDVIAPEALVRALKCLRSAAVSIMSEAGSPAGRKISTASIIENCLESTAERIVSFHYSRVDDMTYTHFLISNITKDMTIYGTDQEKGYFSIVNNLYRVHMDSSYIYTYEEPVLHSAKSEWKQPEMINLRAYHDGDKLAAVTGEAQRMAYTDVLNNSYTPSDRSRIMVVSPLFMNEEQYGVLVSELEHDYFPYIYSITPQICTAIKLTNLVFQLESSLDAAQTRNNVLNKMSMSDELTGIYNRRGFYASANRMLKAPENEGRRGVLIFGDLDNLKQINDTFGHDDGDYAIVAAAGFIKSGLRTSDVVGRIGGDEFAAFAICDDKDTIAKLPSRIKNIAKLHNLKSNKPYNVTISVGLYELICSPELSVQQFMDKADNALYEDKKNKNRDIMKKK